MIPSFAVKFDGESYSPASLLNVILQLADFSTLVRD